MTKKPKPVPLTPESAAAMLGRLGGMKKSDAKTAAVRANGMKGGRPKGSKNKPKP